MKQKLIILAAAVFSVLPSFAQQSDVDYLGRYNRLVSRVGFSGVGVENLLDKWYQADSTDVNVWWPGSTIISQKARPIPSL